VKSYASIRGKVESSRWTVPHTPFMQRMAKHDYALQELSLHEVRFYKRQYENFILCPGDCSPKVESGGG
jgi:hypothetical protein